MHARFSPFKSEQEKPHEEVQPPFEDGRTYISIQTTEKKKKKELLGSRNDRCLLEGQVGNIKQ